MDIYKYYYIIILYITIAIDIYKTFNKTCLKQMMKKISSIAVYIY